MGENEKFKCAICGEEAEDGWFLDSYIDECGFSWLNDELEYAFICNVCAEDLDYYGNKLIYKDFNGKIEIEFNENIYFYDLSKYEINDNISDTMELLEAIMKSYYWHKTDAWRGHYETNNNIVKGWVKAIEGWNDAFFGNEYTEWVKEIMENFKPILVVFPRSSNLCVVYYDVWCKKKDKALIQKLIIPKGEDFDFNRGIYIKAL